MQIRPFAELEREARQRYRETMAAVPPPKVVNLEALVSFGAPREFTVGGVGLRAPPLSYRDAQRLQVVAMALADLRAAGRPDAERVAVLEIAVRLVMPLLFPRRWRLLARRRFVRAFLADPLDAEGVMWFLLHIPDEGANAPATTQVTVDVMDSLADFARSIPAWVGPDGLPLSWAHFQYGTRHLARARARDDLRAATATRVAGAMEKDFKTFHRLWASHAGWS